MICKFCKKEVNRDLMNVYTCYVCNASFFNDRIILYELVFSSKINRIIVFENGTSIINWIYNNEIIRINCNDYPKDLNIKKFARKYIKAQILK